MARPKNLVWAAWAVLLGMHGTLLVVAQNNNFTVKWLRVAVSEFIGGMRAILNDLLAVDQ